MKQIFSFFITMLTLTVGAGTQRDTNGNVVVKLDEETQKRIGLTVQALSAVERSSVVKGYGRVMDPGPLSALLGELSLAQAGYSASSNELARLKTLQQQGNASPKALQTAEAAALRDQLAIQSAQDRLSLEWGGEISGRTDLPSFVRSLISQEAALVRVDLPAGEILKSPPAQMELVSLSGMVMKGAFAGAASAMDPQTQGQGFIFLVKPNTPPLLAGEAVTAELKIPRKPLNGVTIPRDAIVRSQGAGWVYVQSGKESFTRVEVALNHPTEAGWFVTSGVKAGDEVVVTRAQMLLSEELKASIVPDSE